LATLAAGVAAARRHWASAFRDSRNCERHSRDPEKIHLGIEVYGCIDEDPAKPGARASAPWRSAKHLRRS